MRPPLLWSPGSRLFKYQLISSLFAATDSRGPEIDAGSRNLGMKSSEMEDESASSNPYVTAPSSPARAGSSSTGYFFSAPASPVHFFLLKSTSIPATAVEDADEYEVSSSESVCDDFEFEFSTRSMISADEIFLNGQILPLTFLPSQLEEEEKEESPPTTTIEVMVRERDMRSRNRSVRRRTRSMSPVRNTPALHWHDEIGDNEKGKEKEIAIDSAEIGPVSKKSEIEVEIPTESVSASSSRSSSSSSSRNSRRWIFLKDLLHRSKSEGSNCSSNNKEKSHISLPFFSKSKNQGHPKPPPHRQPSAKGRAGIRRRSSVQERHYGENRTQAEDLRKKTFFLPYRQGGFLLGCLGFSSRSYGAMNGFARTLTSVASR